MNVREVGRIFRYKLGASKDNQRDHIYFYLEYQGAEYTVGKLSHSWKGTLNDDQISMLARKLLLKKGEFEQFCACDIPTVEMIKIWQERRQY